MVSPKAKVPYPAAAAMMMLAALVSWEPSYAFCVGSGPGTTGLAQISGLGAKSSFLHSPSSRADAGRTGECSPTSLSSSYVVKPEMARTVGSEWRKMRTRGQGFGEKVSRFIVNAVGDLLFSYFSSRFSSRTVPGIHTNDKVFVPHGTCLFISDSIWHVLDVHMPVNGSPVGWMS